MYIELEDVPLPVFLLKSSPNNAPLEDVLELLLPIDQSPVACIVPVMFGRLII